MNNLYDIPDHLFSAYMKENGNSWTLTTLTGSMLIELENKYGPRDKSWTLLGVEFWNNDPMIWFPGGNETPPPKHIAIRLSPEAFESYKEAMYQLSHECVHLLSPQGSPVAPIIEEGLAKLYSMEIIERYCGHPSGQKYGSAPAYEAAADSVRELLMYDCQAIRKLRDKEPAFKRMSLSTFTAAGLEQVPRQLIDELLADF